MNAVEIGDCVAYVGNEPRFVGFEGRVAEVHDHAPYCRVVDSSDGARRVSVWLALGCLEVVS